MRFPAGVGQPFCMNEHQR